MEKKSFNSEGGRSSTSSLSQEQQQQNSQTASSSSSLLPRGISQNPGLSYTHFFAELLNYHWQRPEENRTRFWRKYVDKYYHPNFVGHSCLSTCKDWLVSPKTDWQCRHCASSPSKGYRVTFETFPRFLKRRFRKVVTSERYDMIWSSEYKPSRGLTALVCEQAAQYTILQQGQCVLWEGVLRVTITDELKILNWDFCVRRNEKYVSLSSLSNMVQNRYRIASEVGQAQQEEEGNRENRDGQHGNK